MTFSDTLTVTFLFPSSFPFPSLRRACLLPFPQSDGVSPAISPSMALYPLTLLCSLFTFLVSEVTPGYILTSEDLELGTTDERDHATFVFPGLDCLTLYNSF